MADQIRDVLRRESVRAECEQVGGCDSCPRAGIPVARERVDEGGSEVTGESRHWLAGVALPDRHLPGLQQHAEQSPPQGRDHLPARQPLLGLAVVRDRHLPHRCGALGRVLLLVDPVAPSQPLTATGTYRTPVSAPSLWRDALDIWMDTRTHTGPGADPLGSRRTPGFLTRPHAAATRPRLRLVPSGLPGMRAGGVHTRPSAAADYQPPCEQLSSVPHARAARRAPSLVLRPSSAAKCQESGAFKLFSQLNSYIRQCGHNPPRKR